MALDFLKRLLGEDGSETARPDDARAAVSAVLVMAARADDLYEDREKRIIDKVLTARYGLSTDDAARLRAEGEIAETESIDHYQFTRAIRHAVPIEERVAILEALWRVVLADDERDPHEDALMRQLADRMGLSPMDLARARQKVIAEG